MRVAFDQHGLVLAWSSRHSANRLGRPDDIADFSRSINSRAKRGGHLVAAADDHGGFWRKPGGGGELSRDVAGDACCRGERGQHARVDARCIENRLGPGA